jgi:hypothetical protein
MQPLVCFAQSSTGLRAEFEVPNRRSFLIQPRLEQDPEGLVVRGHLEVQC